MLLNVKKIDSNDLLRQSIHVSNEWLDQSDCTNLSSSSEEFIKYFQVLLAKKLAASEGNFILSKIVLHSSQQTSNGN
ncbi:hypothetical protein SteCoe_17591 [Stentor coeruleus]|uniref:Uncharacterized protein n=1 Tax=Stentor coeruleus TaxID=5963 RepID=A0A1R2BYL0_9CILI|nr:hypothetical protein SteCoe_17591 [Stentor coeruleus]